MSFANVSPGKKAPQEVNAIIEIPWRGEPVKYEVDKASGTLWVDRFLCTSMYYPCNYGYIPNTLAEDGDPCDILVLSPAPLMSGSVIPVRPIGVLAMTDESGRDVKILSVPIDKLSTMYRHMHEPEDVPDHLLKTISHFFEHYKDLEEGKWVQIDGWKKRRSCARRDTAFYRAFWRRLEPY